MFPSKKSKTRFIVFYILLLSSYFGIILFGLIPSDFINFIVFSLWSFILLHFFYLDFRYLSDRKFWYLIIPFLIGFGLLFLTWSVVIYWIVFSLISLWLFFLLRALKFFEFTTHKYFGAGAYLFSIFLTLSLSLFLVNNYTKINFDCDKIVHYYKNLVTTFQSPISKASDAGIDSLNGMLEWTLSNMSIPGGEGISLEETSLITSIMDSMKSYKDDIITSILEEQDDLNMAMCSHVVDTIQEKAKKPWFRYSVVFLLFILFFSVIRFGVFLLWLINMLIFMLLYRLWIYQKAIVKKDCKELI